MPRPRNYVQDDSSSSISSSDPEQRQELRRQVLEAELARRDEQDAKAKKQHAKVKASEKQAKKEEEEERIRRLWPNLSAKEKFVRVARWPASLSIFLAFALAFGGWALEGSLHDISNAGTGKWSYWGHDLSTASSKMATAGSLYWAALAIFAVAVVVLSTTIVLNQWAKRERKVKAYEESVQRQVEPGRSSQRQAALDARRDSSSFSYSSDDSLSSTLSSSSSAQSDSLSSSEEEEKRRRRPPVVLAYNGQEKAGHVGMAVGGGGFLIGCAAAATGGSLQAAAHTLHDATYHLHYYTMKQSYSQATAAAKTAMGSKLAVAHAVLWVALAIAVVAVVVLAVSVFVKNLGRNKRQLQQAQQEKARDLPQPTPARGREVAQEVQRAAKPVHHTKVQASSQEKKSQVPALKKGATCAKPAAPARRR